MRAWTIVATAALAAAAVWTGVATAQETPPAPGDGKPAQPAPAQPAPVRTGDAGSAQPAPAQPGSTPPAPPPAGRPAARTPDPTRRDLGSYRLRVEDSVEISVYKPLSYSTDLTREILVPANGEISFAPIGRINLLGKTTAEIEEIIAQRLKDENILTNPNVGCFVKKYAPRMVSVIGAVRASIPLPVYKDLRILELLSQVNALETEGADFSRVRIRRTAADGQTFWFDVNVDRVFEQNDEQQNVVVKEGDIIKIERFEDAVPQSADFVYVLGKVNNRGRIPMVRGRYPFTLVRLISICGDFQEFADRGKVKIIRQTETGKQHFIVDFDQILDNERADFELKPDDVVFVPETFF